MLIKYSINKSFQTVTGQSITVSEENINVNSKYISIPLNMGFIPTDYSDDISDLVVEERKKAITDKKSPNKPGDLETIGYKFENTSLNNDQGLLIQFRFWNTNSYSNSYAAVGITSADTKDNSNAFKNSFFKLNFYDSNTGETNNFIFSEYINTFDSTKPTFKLNTLYWLRNDEYFMDNNTNRTLYMSAKFFNAKNGKIHTFINLPISLSFGTAPNIPINIQTYSEPANRGWRYSPIEFINPKLNNGKYNFRVVPGVGGNTQGVITMSEFILK